MHARTNRTIRARWSWIVCVLPLVMMAVPWVAAAVGEQPFKANAAVKGTPVAPGGTATIEVAIEIPADHYIYREATSVDLVDAAGLEAGPTRYPAPIAKFDKWENRDVEIYDRTTYFSIPLTIPSDTAVGSATVKVEARWRGCNPKMCFFPTTEPFELTVEIGEGGAPGTPGEATTPSAEEVDPQDAPSAAPHGGGEDGPAPPSTTSGSGLSGMQQQLADALQAAAAKSFVLVLLIAFLGGILASFTPCVYPMIPITVAVIGARGVGRAKAFSLSLVYVLGIATLYSVLGLVASATQGMLGSTFNNPWVLLGISLLFLLLSLGMFGVYNFALPASINTRLSQVGGQSYAGVFVIGLVGGIIISPCTGPVVGSILLMIASGQLSLLQGFWVMFVFSLGVGVLFVVIGTFSESLQRLPQAGGWMTHVKNSFGFVMILAALYFLAATGFVPSGATGVLSAVALVMWGVVLGVFTPLESEAGWPAWTLRTLAVLLMMLGMLMLGRALFGDTATTSHAEQGIAWQEDIETAMADASAADRPLMFDFTAENCKQCRELEHKTFPDETVVRLSRSFVPVVVDMTEISELEKQLAERYGVPGAPRIVFCAPDGSEIPGTAIQGFVPAGPFAASMENALSATR